MQKLLKTCLRRLSNSITKTLISRQSINRMNYFNAKKLSSLFINDPNLTEQEVKKRDRRNYFLMGYFGFVLVYFFAKSEYAEQMSMEELLSHVRESTVLEMHVLEMDEVSEGEKEKMKKKSTWRIEFNYLGKNTFVRAFQINSFREAIREIQVKQNHLVGKIKIYQKRYDPLDVKTKRLLSAIFHVIVPLMFPFILYKSSVGNLFKSKNIGQLEGIRPNVVFKDVAGLGDAKIEVSQLVDFLKNPKKYKKVGAKIPKGALLTGPPGTGKTMLAKACAGEADVPFFAVSGSEFVELFAGMGASRVRDLFKNAKLKTPAIIFIDEIDAIGRKRDDKFGGAHDERANTLNQLLVEMDGFGTSHDIIVLAATNRREMLDSALTRPGRFDRIVEIELPDIRGRQQILQIYLAKIRLAPSLTLRDYAKRIATLTYGFSGADLANLCNEAAIVAVRANKPNVESQHFQSASDRVLAGLERSIALKPEERRRVAFHQAGHAVVAWFLEGAAPLLKVTIVPRSKGSLGFAQYLPNEAMLQSQKQLKEQLCVILGGRTAEEYFFGEGSNGAADDLKKVRQLCRQIIVNFGMSKRLMNYAPADTEGENIYSESTAQMIDQEIIQLIGWATAETRKLLAIHADKVKALAERVLEKETISHDQIVEILGKRPFEPKQNYKEFLEHSVEMDIPKTVLG